MSCVFCHFFNIFNGCFLEVLSSLDQFHRAELAQVDLDAGAFKKWKEAPQKTSVDLPIASNCNPFHILLHVSMYYVHICPSNLIFWDSFGNANVSILWNFWKSSASKTQVRSLPEGTRTITAIKNPQDGLSDFAYFASGSRLLCWPGKVLGRVLRESDLSHMESSRMFTVSIVFDLIQVFGSLQNLQAQHLRSTPSWRSFTRIPVPFNCLGSILKRKKQRFLSLNI